MMIDTEDVIILQQALATKTMSITWRELRYLRPLDEDCSDDELTDRIEQLEADRLLSTERVPADETSVTGAVTLVKPTQAAVSWLKRANLYAELEVLYEMYQHVETTPVLDALRADRVNHNA